MKEPVFDLSHINLAIEAEYNRSRLAPAMDAGLPKIGEIIELSAMGNSHAWNLKFEVVAVDPRTGLMEARACEANADGEHTLIRMLLRRLQ
ncbi:MAG TPA: hypothetical protein VEJ46_02920 [Candidatus Acidoferrum sp.]|nr:hypothetical protein [Candidatus Acidoferrum sp.]